MKLIFDAMTGTVVDADSCYVVESDDMTDADHAILAIGNDEDISQLGMRLGKRLNEIGQDTGWGDNKYRWTVSYSPKSLKDEADALLDGGIYEDAEDARYKSMLEWVANEATEKELEEISDLAMGADHVWDGFRGNLMEAVHMALYMKHQNQDN